MISRAVDDSDHPYRSPTRVSPPRHTEGCLRSKLRSRSLYTDCQLQQFLRDRMCPIVRESSAFEILFPSKHAYVRGFTSWERAGSHNKCSTRSSDANAFMDWVRRSRPSARRIPGGAFFRLRCRLRRQSAAPGLPDKSRTLG
jgi:hypothetical protein